MLLLPKSFAYYVLARTHANKTASSWQRFLKSAVGTFTELPEHSPVKLVLFQGAQSTSAFVESSFLILKKLLLP